MATQISRVSFSFYHRLLVGVVAERMLHVRGDGGQPRLSFSHLKSSVIFFSSLEFHAKWTIGSNTCRALKKNTTTSIASDLCSNIQHNLAKHTVVKEWKKLRIYEEKRMRGSFCLLSVKQSFPLCERLRRPHICC